jgi:cell fate (sporulation/competence/biofilm development) regulator YmcA (YheA/YmcA/DUF963 family)
MKNYLLIISTVIALSACSTASKNSPESLKLKSQTISTDFTDEGIKITYTFTGKLESIEVYGQAEAWRGNVEAIAEADAMAKLTKFVNGKNISTERRVKVIGKSIEQAQDNKLDKFKSQDGTINVTDKQIDYEPYVDKSQQSSQDASSLRNAKAINETIVTTVTSITSKGRLTGVRKIRDFQRNDGKTYVAVYIWSDKDQATSEYIRNRMQGKPQ